MTAKWLDYPTEKPNQSGYYMTYYYNSDLSDHLYKAIWYNIKEDKWCAWRTGMCDPVVKGFVQESVNDHYVPCLTWAQNNVSEPFEQHQ